MGFQRAKSDKLDSKMIARYLYLYREEIEPTKLPSKALAKIKHLLAYRNRLVRYSTGLQVSSKELEGFTTSDLHNDVVISSIPKHRDHRFDEGKDEANRKGD